MDVFCSVTGVFIENTYFLIHEEEAWGIVVDPGLGALENLKKFKKPELTWKAIFLTHAHFDHLMGVSEIKAFTNAPIYLHQADVFLYELFQEEAAKFNYQVAALPKPDHYWEEGERITIGTVTFEILHTPGHTPGGVCIKWNKGVFTGDTLMHLTVGRTDWHGSIDQLQTSILEKLFTLPEHLPIYPGHYGKSSIGIEKQQNQEVF